MVLINTLTVEAINTALIALQKGQSIVIGGEKGNTVNNITVTNNGGSSGIDYAPLISAVSDRVGLLEKAQKVFEQIQTEQKTKIAALEKLGIQEVEYNDATRELSIRTKDGKTYSTTFPEPYVALDIEGSDLILTSGDMIASVTLPFVLASEKGQPNGVATLDSMGRVPYSQLPESAMEFKGEWDASTNTPELEDGVGTNGDFYICSAGGTVTFGTGHTETFIPNDRVLYNGETEEWIKLPAGQVQSVNGMTGDVVLNIPPAQIQSDWTQTDNTAKDFIKHKVPIWVTQGIPSDNMQPIDSVTDGEMRPVTSNAVYDKHYLTSADIVNQVTVDNMQSVSSNAVARALEWVDVSNDVTLTRLSGSYTIVAKKFFLQGSLLHCYIELYSTSTVASGSDICAIIISSSLFTLPKNKSYAQSVCYYGEYIVPSMLNGYTNEQDGNLHFRNANPNKSYPFYPSWGNNTVSCSFTVPVTLS